MLLIYYIKQFQINKSHETQKLDRKNLKLIIEFKIYN